MVPGLGHDCADMVQRNFKLFRDLGETHAVGEIVEHRVNRHPGAGQHWSTTQHARLDFNERAIRPIDWNLNRHVNPHAYP